MDFDLVPLRDASLEDLMEAAAPAEVWELMPWPIGKDRAAMEAYVATALRDEDAGTALPFAVLQEGRVVGSTRYHAIDPVHRKAEIGYTWYHPSRWRTGLNRAVKIEMLDRGFGPMGLHRIYFQIDRRNERSQNAVAALGAVKEGELREDRILHDGYLRTTVVYGMLAHEWPENRTRLASRVQKLPK